MPTVIPTASSSKETTNYARLCRVLVDVGTQALRDTFDAIHAPPNLHTVLAGNKTTLQALRTRKIINATQWGKLFPAIPSAVSSKNFDTTLLVVLLRNLCCLRPPAAGWDTLPAATDVSLEADIARVKYFRNTVYAHAEHASVDDATFNTYWQDIRDTLVRLGGVQYRAAIDNLETECMDPEIEDHFKELLNQWKEDEENIKDELKEIGTDIKNVMKKLEDLPKSGLTKRTETSDEGFEDQSPNLAAMFDGKVQTFIVLVVLVAFAVASRIETQNNSDRHWRCKTLEPPQPPPFFAGNKRPEGLPNISRGVEIQQTLPDDPNGSAPYFVSLFDPDRNIPFYSAYKVTSQQAPVIGKFKRKDVTGHWRDPPGVPGLDAAYKELIKKEPLSRGHMDPLGINSFDKRFMEATFTYTNAAPQYLVSNSGPWKMFEEKVRWYAQNICGRPSPGGTLYLLTGTSDFSLDTDLSKYPTQNTTPKVFHVGMFLEEVKLVIPNALWTAGCCVWEEASQVSGIVARTESFAVMSNNVNDLKFLNQTEMSVAELELHLIAPGSPPANLFPGDKGCRLSGNNVILV